jgi:hypothetical protein
MTWSRFGFCAASMQSDPPLPEMPVLWVGTRRSLPGVRRLPGRCSANYRYRRCCAPFSRRGVARALVVVYNLALQGQGDPYCSSA